jgi:hypothetical protein
MLRSAWREALPIGAVADYLENDEVWVMLVALFFALSAENAGEQERHATTIRRELEKYAPPRCNA